MREVGGIAPKHFGTLASAVAEELRREIIAGRFRPGEKLRIRQLAQRFGVGLSPVREALNRLSSDRLVTQNDLRGFAVADISLDELEELLLARVWLNDIALRSSIALGDDHWEEQVALAFHRLSRTPRFRDDSRVVDQRWDAAHREFHRALLAACGSKWIVDFCDQLFDVADLYRSVARSAPEMASRLQDDEHRKIMEAALSRNADAAVGELTDHLTRTAEMVRQTLGKQPSAKARRSQDLLVRTATKDSV